jgi:predicted DNA-binding transcriptional regulator AlpA
MDTASKQLDRGAATATPEYLRVPEAIRLSGIGRSTLYSLIANGSIASRLIKTSPHNIGGLRLISTTSLRAFIEGCASK